MEGLEKIRDLTWNEVFDTWRQGEAGSEKWRKVWESRGFESWDEWRMQYAGPFKCPQRAWALYGIPNPTSTIPKFYGGPFRTWMALHYGGNSRPSMAELASRKDMQEDNANISLLENYPKETTLIGLIQDNDIVIIEGMHRAITVALAAQQNKSFTSKIFIALADASGEELPTVGRTVKQKL